jgi:adenylate cyclase
MTDTGEQSSKGGIDPSYIYTIEIVERPAPERPARDTIGGIAEWLIGPALDVATGAQAIDELAWRILAADFPLARLTLHSGVLHPQFLGTSFIWWRDTGQTVQTFVAHEVRDVVPYQHNPVLRVIQGGETLRRRVDVADGELDFPIVVPVKS